METEKGDANFGEVFCDLSTAKQKEVLRTAKTLLNVQRVSSVLIDCETDIKAFSINEKKAG